jgi:tetratricopeptide (TPR) repeat protein
MSEVLILTSSPAIFQQLGACLVGVRKLLPDAQDENRYLRARFEVAVPGQRQSLARGVQVALLQGADLSQALSRARARVEAQAFLVALPAEPLQSSGAEGTLLLAERYFDLDQSFESGCQRRGAQTLSSQGMLKAAQALPASEWRALLPSSEQGAVSEAESTLTLALASSLSALPREELAKKAQARWQNALALSRWPGLPVLSAGLHGLPQLWLLVSSVDPELVREVDAARVAAFASACLGLRPGARVAPDAEERRRLGEAERHYLEATRRLQAGQWAIAIAGFSKALSIDESYAEAWSNRAVARIQLRDFEGAMSDLDRAIGVKPDLGAAHFNRACILARPLRAESTDEACADTFLALERALENGFSAELIAQDEDLLALRARPRFQALIGVPAQ